MKKIFLLSIIALTGCIETQLEKKEISSDTDEAEISDSNQLPPAVDDGSTDSIDSVTRRSNVAPVFNALTPITLDQASGENLSVTIQASNQQELNGALHWTKSFGPDDVVVHSESGLVSWDIPDDMPSESFHIGLNASSQSDVVSLNFVVHAGVTQVVTVGPEADYTTLKAGLSALTSGGTLLMLDGTYTGEDNYIGRVNSGNLQHPPSGTESGYTTIMAKHPGKVTLSDGAMVSLKGLPGQDPVSYAAFKGLFVIDGQLAAHGYPDDATTRHHHIKFIRNGAQGGSGKAEPFNTSYADNILFENNYAFGGGRYKFTSYLASNIVWRRNVARYDHGPVPNEPKGTYSVYSSMDAFLSNNIAVDGDQPEFLDSGEIAGEFATPTTAGPTRARFQRNIQLNGAMMFTNLSNINGDSDVELSDMVSWDVRPDKSYIKSFASGWLDHITMGDITSRNHADTFVHGWGGNFRGVTNSILHNFKNGDMFSSVRTGAAHETVDGRMVERYGADTINISNFDGTLNVYDSDTENITNLDPIQSESNLTGSLRYITRIEPDTSLSEMDQDGNGLGATVMTFVGKSGTFFGETGYDVETNIPMWPFPMEAIIKEKMGAYSYTGNTYTGTEHNRVVSGTGTIVGARGFAIEGQSLTNYIWGYLENVVPPFNVTASPRNNSVLLQWSAGEVEPNIVTEYKIYQYNLETNEKVLVESVDGNTLIFNVENLVSDQQYTFIVTRLIGNRESGFSYPVSVEIL